MAELLSLNPPRSRSSLVRPALAAPWRRASTAIVVVAVALLFRPYHGIWGDSRIYIGRALADLDPAGVGRDLMFASDGQSGFSIYPRLLARAVALLGAPLASRLVSLAALAAWTAAAALMLGAWLGRERRLASLVAVLVAPAAYGGFALVIGEAAAVPRPFAEAFVLAGLWALLTDRRVLAVGFMALAAAFHPIMALPGFGLVFVMLSFEDRRWLWALPLAVAAMGLAAALRLPLFDRLLRPIDGAWLGVLRVCSPYLFLRAWPLDVWGRIVVQAGTAAAAATVLQGRARRVLLAGLVVAALALAASAVLGDGAKVLLAVQAQPWRGLWLLSFLAAASIPIAVYDLWGMGGAGRLAVAAMAAAWASVLTPLTAVGATALMLILVAAARRGLQPSRWVAFFVWGCVLALVGVYATMQAEALGALALSAPPQARLPLNFLILSDLPRVLAEAVALAAGAWLATGRTPRGAAAAAALLALALGAVSWAGLEPNGRMLESPTAAGQVRALVATRPGAVQWAGGDLEPVLLAGRPAWWTEVQAASSVFSRPQALEWARRSRRLVETGVGPVSLLAPFPHPRPAPLWSPSLAAIRAFCGAGDAPAWLVLPFVRGLSAPPAGAAVWTAPVVQARREAEGRSVPVRDYAFMPCASVTAPGSRSGG